MACRTASVQRVADKSIAAKTQLEKLTDEITGQKDKHLATFNANIISHLKSAKVDDQREIDANDYIKTEYTSEFSLDKIAEVVKKSLKTIATLKNPSVGNPALSDAAINSYIDMVNVVSEAAKSSSTSSGSLTFSMNRMSPGLFAFLGTSSVSMREEETFGSESVTSTIVFYRVVESIQDIKSETKFIETRIDSENLIKLKGLQAQLTDQLAAGTINLDEWMKKDSAFSNAIEQVNKRLQAHHFAAKGIAADPAILGNSVENQKLVLAAIGKLSSMGAEYAVVIETSKKRIENSYF